MNPDLSVIARFGLLDEASVARAQRGLRQLAARRRDMGGGGRSGARRGAHAGVLRTTVEAHLAADRCRVGEDLLRHLLAAHQHEDACLDLGSSRWGWEEAWARWLLDPGVPVSVATPGEPAEELATRILATLGALGLQTGRRELWQARILALLGRGAGAEAEALWERLARSGSPLATASRVDRAAVCLERGQVAEASRLLASVASDSRAGVLLRWMGALHGRGSSEGGGPAVDRRPLPLQGSPRSWSSCACVGRRRPRCLRGRHASGGVWLARRGWRSCLRGGRGRS
ncbi:MAG: hypothetical protein O2799_10160 [Planctomycetota bacterium]|nr:hypothetical protein [Planctomycetota bacterium]